jgi:hypothetical protein
MKSIHRATAKTILAILTAGLIALSSPARLEADTFILRDGRILTGELVSREKVDASNPDRKAAQTDEQIRIKVDDGVDVVILKSELAHEGHRKKNEYEEKYEKAAVQIANTAEDHCKLAAMCAKAGLPKLEFAHYLRAIDLDPDHGYARAAVKHKQDKSGRWVRNEDHMHRMGKIEVGLKWDYPENVREEAQKSELQALRADVKKAISAFQLAFLKSSPKLGQALEAVEQRLSDPTKVTITVEELAIKLDDKPVKGLRPIPDPLKLEYIRLLAKSGMPFAFGYLAKAAVMDSSEAIRNAALDVIEQNNQSQVASNTIRTYLRIFTRNMAGNEQINRAAYALGKLKASEATLDLIDVLVTKHEVPTGVQNDTYSADGTTMGAPKSKVLVFKNENVQSALAQITNQGNLGYDRAAWLNWYASLNASPVDDLRRDF